jgi:hypothetical protein
MSLLYQPPPGYFDLPFTWVFDGSGLTDGSNSINNSVSVYAGYGDFIMRRIAGLDYVLASAAAPNFTGQYQIRDARGRYLQSVPQYIGRFTGIVDYSDLAIQRELRYQENSTINFDLYDIARANYFGGYFAAQIAFQGVRRQPGVSPFAPTFNFQHKTFMYNASAVLPLGGGTTLPSPLSIYQKVTNYDFELYQVNIAYGPNASYVLAFGATTTGMTFYSALAANAGSGTQVILAKTAVPNSPLTVTVSGTTITLTGATDGSGNTITTGAGIQQAINNNPSASALVLVENVVNPTFGYVAGTYTLLGGGAIIQSGSPNALVQLYDQYGVVTSYQPMVDNFVNGGIYSAFKNGAIVPPLLYKQNSQIRMDVIPLINSEVVTMFIQYVGKQRIPC